MPRLTSNLKLLTEQRHRKILEIVQVKGIASGLELPQGITDPNLLEIQIKRAMLASAKRAILLLDSTKFGVSSLTPIVPLESIQVLITDKDAPEEYLDRIREMGIEVHIAK
ncbi:MAG: hypothetical protein WCK35_22140 [Chloroflexota bacterium]